MVEFTENGVIVKRDPSERNAHVQLFEEVIVAGRWLWHHFACVNQSNVGHQTNP